MEAFGLCHWRNDDCSYLIDSLTKQAELIVPLIAFKYQLLKEMKLLMTLTKSIVYLSSLATI